MNSGEIESLLSEDTDVPTNVAAISPSTEDTEDSARGRISTSEDTYVRETVQKGEGMSALKGALSMFTNNSHPEQETLDDVDSEIGDKDLEYQLARQSRLERDALSSAIERWRKENEQLQKVGAGLDGQLKSLGARLWEWQQNLARRLEEEIALCELAEQNKGISQSTADRNRWEYGPFLALSNPNQIAALAILTAIHQMTKYNGTNMMKMTPFVVNVGKALEEEVVAAQLSKALQEDMRYSKKAATKMVQKLPKLGRGQWLGQRSFLSGKFDGMSHPPWPTTIHAKVGAAICSHLFEAAKVKIYKEDPKTGKKISNMQPVFTRSTKFEHGMRKHYVGLHWAVDANLRREPPGSLIAKHVPMVAKPRRWSSFDVGGYLTTSSGFLRIKNQEVAQRRYAEAAMERGDLDGYFAGLNVLGETGWRINYDVFQVMRKAWNSGEAIGKLALEDPQVKIPPRPTSNDQLSQRKWAQEVEKAEQSKAGIHSHRCFQNFQLEIARAFLNETFYLPHNIDFRGRAYPIPPYLHQMGADNCRGLLLFAEGRELGEAGLRWLKVHLANVYGFDKASLSDREAFAMENMHEIIDSTDKPLDGRKWWLEADDPWQCLATSFELRNALNSPDPTKYVSHLPVHQDGSCNGLQHYAALGGDHAGAQQVNLEPGDLPSDVYTGVAEMVKAEIVDEAAKGNTLAQLLEGKITRKIVKTTVMTNVYGVTFMGATRQVRKRLEELYPELEHTPQGRMTVQLSVYIAAKIFRALGAMFSGAHDIQYWLGDCATRINASLTPDQLDAMAAKYAAEKAAKTDPQDANAVSKEKPLIIGARKLSPRAAATLRTPLFRCSVTWTTPLKLPVIQPYRDAKLKRIDTPSQSMSISSPSFHDGIHKRKQLQAFPPNFIHSLDATHMMLSAVKCRENGLTFSAVHDSFWTHAADVDQMNEILREEFVRMHSENIIGRLAAEFTARYRGNLYQASVKSKTKVAQKIQEWKVETARSHGFRVNGPDFQRLEVLLEHKRQILLKSSDPEEQRQGKEMITGASIFEADDHANESLYVVNSLGETAIGHVPEVTSTKILEEAVAGDNPSDDANPGEMLLPDPLKEDEQVEGDTASSIKEAFVEATDAMDRREKKIRRSARKNPIALWLPIQFPPIPEKVSLLGSSVIDLEFTDDYRENGTYHAFVKAHISFHRSGFSHTCFVYQHHWAFHRWVRQRLLVM